MAELACVGDPHMVYNRRAKIGAMGWYGDNEVNRIVNLEMSPAST